MVKAIGIVNLHSDVDFVGLTERRPVASVSFLGRYALIDFVLSNMSNSTIDAVGVLIQKKPRSLFKHLGNGDSWNFNSKAGFHYYIMRNTPITLIIIMILII